MRYRYRVYHSENAKSDIDRHFHAFSRDDEFREYQLFPSALAHLYHEDSVEACSAPAEPETNGVVVTLVTDLPEPEAASSLDRFLTRLNAQIPGLCFVVEKLGS